MGDSIHYCDDCPNNVGCHLEQLRGYDKHLRVCMGWTMRASELEASSGMREAQLADLKAAESFLANAALRHPGSTPQDTYEK